MTPVSPEKLIQHFTLEQVARRISATFPAVNAPAKAQDNVPTVAPKRVST